MKKKWMTVIHVLASLAAAIAIAFGRGFGTSVSMGWNARYLSDGFFAVGFIQLGLGVLTWIATTGFFDMLQYGFKSLLVLFTTLVKPKEHPGFYEYHETKEAKRGKPSMRLILTGALQIAISIVLVVVYHVLTGE